MEKLVIDQRQTIGFQFLMDNMAAITVYGADEIKKVHPYSRMNKKKLELEFNEIEKMLLLFPKEKKRIGKIELVLMFVKEIRGSLKNASRTTLNDIELFELKNFLIQMEKLKPLFQDLNQIIKLETILFEDLRIPLDILDPDGKRIPSFYISEKYSPELKEIREQKKKIEVSLRGEMTQGKKEELLLLRRTIVAKEADKEQEVRRTLTQELLPFIGQIEKNVKMTGKLDFLIQKTKLAMKYKGVKPSITNTEVIMKKIINPQIQEFLNEKGKVFTPISISMKEGVTVLTGANMGGKSVALQTVILNLYLAQCGFFAYGEKVEFPILDYLLVIAEEYQSVKDGLSSFGGEIVKLKDSLEQMKEGYGLLVMDELARGTNPDEGAAIVRGLVRYLNQRPMLSLMATHYDHIAEYGNAHYQVYGLKDMDVKKIQQEIVVLGEDRGLELIGKCMNYGIFLVTEPQNCPKDALNVCHLLGLQEDVMELIEESNFCKIEIQLDN